jgi:PPOX class probable F420-dependent enzyme
MNADQIEAFIHAPRHAIVSVIRADGPPQLSPVWYLYQEGRFYISVLVESAKYRHLQRDPRISICIDGGHPDARFVTIYGKAELVEDGDPRFEEIRWRITRRYCASDEEARQYMEEAPPSAQAMIVVSPEKMIGRDYN